MCPVCWQFQPSFGWCFVHSSVTYFITEKKDLPLILKYMKDFHEHHPCQGCLVFNYQIVRGYGHIVDEYHDDLILNTHFACIVRVKTRNIINFKIM